MDLQDNTRAKHVMVYQSTDVSADSGNVGNIETLVVLEEKGTIRKRKVELTQ